MGNKTLPGSLVEPVLACIIVKTVNKETKEDLVIKILFYYIIDFITYYRNVI